MANRVMHSLENLGNEKGGREWARAQHLSKPEKIKTAAGLALFAGEGFGEEPSGLRVRLVRGTAMQSSSKWNVGVRGIRG